MQTDQNIMNSLMVKFYKSLSAGDTVGGIAVIPEKDYFLSVASPGLPVTPEDLAFTTGLSQSVEELEAASAFAEITNNIPSSSGLWRMTGKKLWDEYAKILDDAVLPVSVLSSSEQGQLASAQAKLWMNIAGINGMETVMTPLYRTYIENRTRIEAAQLEYNSQLIDATANPNSPAAAVWSVNEPILRERIEALKREWIAAGSHIVEAAQATIAQLTGRDPFRSWSDYRQRFQSALRADSIGTPYYLTTAIPNNFYNENNGWVRFSFKTTETDNSSINSPLMPLVGGGVRSSYSLWSFKETIDREEKKSFAANKSGYIEVSLEFKRVPIRRIWADTSIFTNRGWQWPVGKELLSDGNIPPAGSLILYPFEIIVVKNIKFKININSSVAPDELKKIVNSHEVGLGMFRLRGGTLLNEIKPKAALALNRTGIIHNVDSALSSRVRTDLALRRTIFPNFPEDPIIPPPLRPHIPLPPRPPVIPPPLRPHPPLLPLPPRPTIIPPKTVHDSVITSEEISVIGMQIIGFGCRLLPKCPNHDPRLSWPS